MTNDSLYTPSGLFHIQMFYFEVMPKWKFCPLYEKSAYYRSVKINDLFNL